MTDIYVDGDACPVREEIYRVAARLRLNVFVVSNTDRKLRDQVAAIADRKYGWGDGLPVEITPLSLTS